MRTVVVLYVLLAQSSASFYYDITGALGSVKSKVGKLFSDVGHDVKEAVDCATFAVEEVIYDKDQISHYYDKCLETSTESTSTSLRPVTEAPAAINIIIKPLEPVVVENIQKAEATTKPSIVFVDNSKDIEQKLSKVELVVNDEFSHVDNVTSHLENEFLGLAKDVDEKLKAIEQEKADVQKTLLEIKQLHLQEELEIEKNKDEIRKIFEEILKRMNKSTEEADLRSEMNDAVKHIEKYTTKAILEEIEMWKNKGVEQLKELKTSEAGKYSSLDIPRSFKDLITKIPKETTGPTDTFQETSTIAIRTRSLSTTTSPSSRLVSSTPIVSSMGPLTSKESSTFSDFQSYNKLKASLTVLSTQTSTISKDISTTPIRDTRFSSTPSNSPTTSASITVPTHGLPVSQSSAVTTTTPQSSTRVYVNSSMTSITTPTPTRTTEATPILNPSTRAKKNETSSEELGKHSTTVRPTIVKSEIFSSPVTLVTSTTAQNITVDTNTSDKPYKQSTTTILPNPTLLEILTSASSTTFNSRPSDVTTNPSIEPSLKTSTSSVKSETTSTPSPVATSTSSQDATVATTTSEKTDKLSTTVKSTAENRTKPPLLKILTSASLTTSYNQPTEVTTTPSKEPELQNSTVTSTTSLRLETTLSPPPLVISTTSQVATLATITEKPNKQATTVSSYILSNPSLLEISSTTSNYRSKDVAIVANTEPVLQTSTVTSTSTVEPVTTTQVTTSQLPSLILTVADKPVMELITTTTTTKPISSNTISTEAAKPVKKSPRKKVGKKSKKKRARPHAHLKVHQVTDATPPPPKHSDVDDLIPEDTAAAVADALKIFGGSIKRKAVLDKFFKNFDAV